MSNQSNPAQKTPLIRRIWKPAAVTGAGGTAVAIWFNEIMLFAEDLLALIFLPIMAGVIYLLNIFIFRSHMPQRDNTAKTQTQGDQR